ncbi:MAG: SAP domain-containing protein [Coriobacteriia bacterium]|nr:SAP domain-containing protein [Coriobacteriia bacterium]
MLLDAPGHRIPVDDLKPAVRHRIREHAEASKSIDLKDAAKGYRLYSKLLIAAWEFEGDLVEAEANLLRVLRQELGVTRKAHQLIMAHPEVGRLRFDAAEYDEALCFLSNEGIMLVQSDNSETHFVLSDETADSLLQLWGFEMQHAQCDRMLDALSKSQLVRSLRTAGLRTSGSNSELARRIVENEIPPSRVLSYLPTAEMGELLGKLGLPKSGNKEDRGVRVIEYFKSDADIAPAEPEIAVVEVCREAALLAEEASIDLLSGLGTALLGSALGSLGLPKSGSKSAQVSRLIESPFNVQTILESLSLDDLRSISVKHGLRRSGNKSDLIELIVDSYADRCVEDSPFAAKDLLDFYEELSCQDRRAYPADMGRNGLSTSRIALDFERATRYIFKNLLRLDTKVQRAGCEDPDGTLVDDDGFFYCYECKTVLEPPYSLPIQHRLQVRNYVTSIATSRRADQFRGYLVISHSFVNNIEDKLKQVQPPMDVPLAVIAAGELLAFARSWQHDHPIETYPIGAALRSGVLTAKDLQRAVYS